MKDSTAKNYVYYDKDRWNERKKLIKKNCSGLQLFFLKITSSDYLFVKKKLTYPDFLHKEFFVKSLDFYKIAHSKFKRSLKSMYIWSK